MNKKSFRIIFSKTLQRLVVVSELAKSAGKGSETCATSGDVWQKIYPIRPLTFSLFCALGFVSFSESALAELIIQADKSAPKHEQPIILKTANGLPQVNIQTPNDKGLSHNKYRQFDVDTQGAILNNSRTQTQTQQAGMIQGNPYLARGEAKVILNEVTSHDPSVLKGYVEVAGKKADVIIANPSGLHCEGCGIINSDRVTLTTGKPQIQQGNLESFVVEKGKVKVSGKGLDNSRVDYTDIIAKETEINAGVWSKKKLTAVTGKNTVKARSASDSDDGLQILNVAQQTQNTAENEPLNSAVVNYAVDVSELGGMYAGKVHLIGTEHGLGVRNAGHIGASSENVMIDSQGRIVNQGIINGANQARLNAKQGIDNQGKIETKQGDIYLQTQADIKQDGSIVARQGNIQKRAGKAISQTGETVARGKISLEAKQVEASESSLLAAGVKLEKREQSERRTLATQADNGSDIQVTSQQQAVLNGKNIASGTLRIHAQNVNLDKSQTSANNIDIKAKNGDIQANQAKVSVKEALRFSTPKTLAMEGSHITAKQIETEQNHLNTTHAVWEQTGDQRLQLKAQTINNQAGAISTKGQLNVEAKQLDNSKGRLVSHAEIAIKTDEFNNEAGRIISNHSQTIESQKLNNQQGIIASQNGGIDLTLSTLLNNRQGTISAKNQLNVTAYGIDNANGTLYSELGDLMLDTQKQHLANQQGQIYTQQNLVLNSQSLTNDRGNIKATKQAEINLSRDLAQDNGHIEAQKLHLVANTLNSTDQSLILADNLHIETTDKLNNQDSHIIAKRNGNIQTGNHLNNTNGTLGSQQGSLTVDTKNHQFINVNGTAVAAQAFTIGSGLVDNKQGHIRATDKLTLNAHHLENQQGNITSANQLMVETTQKLDNQNGSIFANNQLQIASHEINNQQGLLQSNKALAISTQALDNQAGSIIAKEVAHIISQSINNKATSEEGSLIYAKSLTLEAPQLDNQGTKAKDAQPTQGIQGQHIVLNTTTLNNQQGGIYSSNNLSINADGRVDNNQGELLALNTLQVQHHDHLMLNNEKGLIQANNLVELNAKGLESEGTIRSQDQLVVSLKDSFTLNNAVEANNLVFKTAGDLTNNVEQVVANKMTVSANHIINNMNAVLSASETLVNANHLTNRGLIDGDKTLINSTKVTNIGTGRIYGNHLAFDASTVENLSETIDGETKAATIAARSRLDFGVEKLINRDHSLILSLDQLFVGGALNADHYATGKATLVDNGSATIESLGDGRITTSKLLNHDMYLQLGIHSTTEDVEEIALESKPTERYRVGVDGYYGWSGRTAWFRFYDTSKPTLSEKQFYVWRYKRTTHTPYIAKQDKARLNIGGDLYLDGEDLHNKYSQMSIGGKLFLGDQHFERNDNNESLSANGITLRNEDIEKIINIDEKGEALFLQHYRRHGRNGHRHAKISDYIKPTYAIHSSFNEVDNTIGHPISSDSTVAEKANAKAITLDNVSAMTQMPMMDNEITQSEQVIAGLNTQGAQTELKNKVDIALPVIKTELAEISLPQASLYQINPEAPNGYLVETDAKFTDRTQWLSSDYMLTQLRYNHDNVHKRLGDGFYEQRLINEQINQLTGRRYLEGYRNDIEQYKALMDSGVKYAKQFNLTMGVGLSAQQMAELTTDMVWFVNKTVTLANGQKLTVLTPQVYLVARNSDITSHGAVISANQIVGHVNEVQNSGVIAGRDLTRIHSNQLENQGVILGNSVDLSTIQRLVNLGGRIEAAKALYLSSGKELTIASTLSEAKNDHFEQIGLDKVASVKVTGEGGILSLYSDGEMSIKAADIASNGTATAQANHLIISTEKVKNKEHYNGDADNYYRLDQSSEVGSQFQGKEGVTLISTEEMKLRQAEVNSLNGNVTLVSKKGDIQVEAGSAEEQLGLARKSTSRGLLSKTTGKYRYAHHITEAQSSNIEGKNVHVLAEQGNITMLGSNAAAENELVMVANKDIAILSDTNTYFRDEKTEHKKSGLMGSGGIGFSIGMKQERLEQDRTKESAARSQVGSLTGNTIIQAGNHYQQTGSVVTSGKGDIDISAQSAEISAARSDYESHYKYSMEQKGVTIALTGAVASAVQAVDSTLKSAKALGSSKNDRINALSAVNAGFEAMRTAEQVQGIAKAASEGSATGGAVGVSITYGQQKSEQTQHSKGNTVEKSQVNAGGKVNIRTTGKGEQSHITIVGSDVAGQADTHLTADGKVNIKAIDENHLERSKNKSSGFNVGVAVQFGNGIAAGVTAGGNVAKGYGNGESQAWVASQVGSQGSKTVIESGQDTHIIGSQVKGKRVEVTAENLNIESLQDTAKYKGKQESVSGQVMVGYGVSVGGSYGKSKINSDYASVKTQAGILAGDDGYDVNIQNHTELTGGLVTSTDKAEDNHKNRFSTGTLNATNLENHAEYKGSSIGVSGSIAMNFDTPLGNKESGIAQSHKQAENEKGEKIYVDSNGHETTEAQTGGTANRAKLAEGLASLSAGSSLGYGSESDSQHSQTKSGINTANLNIRDMQAQLDKMGKTLDEVIAQVKTEVTTDTYKKDSGVLVNRFDKDKIQKELDYQVKALKDFQEITLPQVNSYVSNKAQEYEKAAERLEKAGKIEEATVAREQARNWEMGGKYRQATDAAMNASGLFLGGSPTAGVVAGVASPYLNQAIKENTAPNSTANLIAHGVLGAVEMGLQGGNAGVGAMSAMAGEVSAAVIAEHLYGAKDPSSLTESQKETVSQLSQLVGASISGGASLAMGGNSYTAIKSADLGKNIAENAVENNFLSQREWDILEKLSKQRSLLPQEAELAQSLFDKHARTNEALLMLKESPETVSEVRKEELFKTILEISNGNSEIEKMLFNSDPNKQATPYFPDLKYKVNASLNYRDSTHGKLSESLNTGLQAVMINNVVGLASGSTKAVVSAAATISAGTQYLADGRIEPKKVALDIASTYFAQYTKWKGTLAIGAANGAINNYWDNKNPASGALLGVASTYVGMKIGDPFEKLVNNKLNPVERMSYMEPHSVYPFIFKSPKENVVPKFVGEISSGVTGEIMKQNMENKIMEIKNETK
ncbi:hemagglutinin repeat-containing protein [Actinobacillus vicugnae]|uniref:two-partner secretion domain-containing protein n=1 Tax=Actinobacillus vicugnae TaxID=2573093 RepID=UPI001240A0A4|nr:hemagglutinin repeat-containing protein [Actinobacillus vicugnae]